MRIYQCECDSPLIKCSDLGCHCVLCGRPERISPGLQKAIDETRQMIRKAADKARHHPRQENEGHG